MRRDVSCIHMRWWMLTYPILVIISQYYVDHGVNHTYAVSSVNYLSVKLEKKRYCFRHWVSLRHKPDSESTFTELTHSASFVFVDCSLHSQDGSASSLSHPSDGVSQCWRGLSFTLCSASPFPFLLQLTGLFCRYRTKVRDKYRPALLVLEWVRASLSLSL